MHLDFFMDVSQALNIINDWKPNKVETLADLLPIELINEAYSLTDTVMSLCVSEN
jgi:hypothetical protein